MVPVNIESPSGIESSVTISMGGTIVEPIIQAPAPAPSLVIPGSGLTDDIPETKEAETVDLKNEILNEYIQLGQDDLL
jgi:hypothetical protein